VPEPSATPVSVRALRRDHPSFRMPARLMGTG
jgi:hypothetical protein